MQKISNLLNLILSNSGLSKDDLRDLYKTNGGNCDYFELAFRSLLKQRLIGLKPVYSKRYNGTLQYEYDSVEDPKIFNELHFKKFKKRGIYMLFQRERLVYVGMTTDFESRIKQHCRSKKIFCSHFFFDLNVRRMDLLGIEGNLIEKYIPRYNKCFIAKKARQEKRSIPYLLEIDYDKICGHEERYYKKKADSEPEEYMGGSNWVHLDDRFMSPRKNLNHFFNQVTQNHE